MLESLILCVFCAANAPALPPHACDELGIERGTVQTLPDVEFGASAAFMLTLDGKPRAECEQTLTSGENCAGLCLRRPLSNDGAWCGCSCSRDTVLC